MVWKSQAECTRKPRPCSLNVGSSIHVHTPSRLLLSFYNLEMCSNQSFNLFKIYSVIDFIAQFLYHHCYSVCVCIPNSYAFCKDVLIVILLTCEQTFSLDINMHMVGAPWYYRISCNYQYSYKADLAVGGYQDVQQTQTKRERVNEQLMSRTCINLAQTTQISDKISVFPLPFFE